FASDCEVVRIDQAPLLALEFDATNGAVWHAGTSRCGSRCLVDSGLLRESCRDLLLVRRLRVRADGCQHECRDESDAPRHPNLLGGKTAHHQKRLAGTSRAISAMLSITT